MTTQSPPFIVDNPETDRRVWIALKEWCGLSRQLDIASGCFEIGAPLCLEEEWRKADRIRLLIGDAVAFRAKRAFEEGRWRARKAPDGSLKRQKMGNDILKGAPGSSRRSAPVKAELPEFLSKMEMKKFPIRPLDTMVSIDTLNP
jgi:hypothetical protein